MCFQPVCLTHSFHPRASCHCIRHYQACQSGLQPGTSLGWLLSAKAGWQCRSTRALKHGGRTEIDHRTRAHLGQPQRECEKAKALLLVLSPLLGSVHTQISVSSHCRPAEHSPSLMDSTDPILSEIGGPFNLSYTKENRR